MFCKFKQIRSNPFCTIQTMTKYTDLFKTSFLSAGELKDISTENSTETFLIISIGPSLSIHVRK